MGAIIKNNNMKPHLTEKNLFIRIKQFNFNQSILDVKKAGNSFPEVVKYDYSQA